MPFREITSNDIGLVGIGVDITDRCNRRCRTCFAVLNHRDMPVEVFHRIADEGSRLKFPELYILGGEPCTRPDILNILRYAKERFKLVILVTNADYLADENLCRQAAEIGVAVAAQRHSIAVGWNARAMEKFLCGGDHFDTSVAGWKNIQKYFSADKISVQCCIIKPVVESGSIFDVFRWVRKNGYEPVMEFTKEGRTFKRDCEEDVSPEEMAKVFAEFRRIDQEEFSLPGAELFSPQRYGGTCHMQENSVHFKVDGTAIPCVGFPCINYGNIMEASLDEILASPIRQQIKNPTDWIYGYCRDECQHFSQCTGGCRGSALDMTGCYKASFYYCPHIPRERLSLRDMIPPTCDGCPLKGHPSCNPKR